MKTYLNVSSRTLKGYLSSQVGTEFFTVTFIKKDGSIRVMNCRNLKSRADLNGKLLTVYDMKKKEFRCINVDRILTVRTRQLILSLEGK